MYLNYIKTLLNNNAVPIATLDSDIECRTTNITIPSVSNEQVISNEEHFLYINVTPKRDAGAATPSVRKKQVPVAQEKDFININAMHKRKCYELYEESAGTYILSYL